MTYIEPVLSLVILLLVLSRLGPRRRLKLRNRLLMFATIILFLWSWPVVAKLTSATLECWYFGDAMPGGDADAIVVLSAGAFLFYPEPPGPVAGDHTYVRTRYAAWLYRQW